MAMNFNVPAPPFDHATAHQIGYIAFGFTGFSLSTLIALSLLFKSVELRQGQRHILLTTMEFSNLFLTLAYFLAGCFRLKYVLTGEYKLHVTTWQCMHRIYPPLFTFALPFVSLTLFVTVSERFLAVSFPLIYYNKVRTCHQRAASFLLVILSSLCTGGAFLCSYLNEHNQKWPYNCILASSIGPTCASVFYVAQFALTTSSASISLATIVLIVRRRKPGDQQEGRLPSTYRHRQKALTNALLPATVVVFLLMCFPVTVELLTFTLRLAPRGWFEQVHPYNNFIIISHCIVSDVILLVMNRQVRTSVRNLIRSISSKFSSVDSESYHENSDYAMTSSRYAIHRGSTCRSQVVHFLYQAEENKDPQF